MASLALPLPGDEARHAAAPIAVPDCQIRALDWPCWEAPSMREAWDRLADCAVEPNPFFESWYLLPALRAFDPGETVQLLMFEAGGQLAGIVPVAREKRYYGRRVSHLAGWTHPNCFLGAPLVAAGRESEFWSALLGWADGAGCHGLFLHLTGLPLEGALHRALQAVLASEHRPGGIVHREERALLAAGSSPEDYFAASLSNKKRKELRRQLNRLCEQGEVGFARSQSSEGLPEWVDRFFELEAAGWKGKQGSALAASTATASLFRHGLEGAAELGKLERLTLSLDGKPIAMLANFIAPPGAFSFKTTYDETYARFSPGVLLQCENLLMLDREDVAWTDSCASQDHPMIDHIWRERRVIGSMSIAIGGKARRALYRPLLKAELRRNPRGGAA